MKLKAFTIVRSRLLTSFLLSAVLLTAWCVQAAVLLQAPLPKLIPWQGASENLIVNEGGWITPAEASDFSTTPDYQHTRAFIRRLTEASADINSSVIGSAASGRELQLVTLSENGSDPKTNGKPSLLVQAGIHSGEIDGKDASLMLLRDYVTGKSDLHQLIKRANLLLIPILNADGHERAGLFNRMNQRGPDNAGWRTNSNNQNLNRDYSKLDTPGLRAVMEVINAYQPSLYLDIHVTDGEDYQYDITYGYTAAFASDSPAIAKWLETSLQQKLDRALTDAGHIPGPLVFGVNSQNFSDGINHWTALPRFSNGLGDLRHTPTVLVENHSLKPYRQRVLGSYVVIKTALSALAEDSKNIQAAIVQDSQRRPKRQVLEWRTNEKPDLTVFARKPFKGIDYKKEMNPISGAEQVVWLGEAKDYPALPVFADNVKSIEVDVPKAFYLPKSATLVIERLKAHGIKLSEPKPRSANLTQMTVTSHEFAISPFEGRYRVKGEFAQEQKKMALDGMVKVSTDQPLGNLAVALLDPRGPDSFFQWGFFNHIFQRTEYYEPYALIPLAELMLKQNPVLKKEFELRLQDKNFAEDPEARMNFFYQRSPYFDQAYLKYPVLMEY